MPLRVSMRFGEYFPIHRRLDVLLIRLEPLDRIVFCENRKKSQKLEMIFINLLIGISSDEINELELNLE